tara:strand:- start:2043 stop:2708 length:666 start_codon:yes stop_codon:yes gene_type:complete
MTIKHVTLNSIVPAFSTIVNGVEIDGYVDGQPMQFVRTADNRLKPAIGTTVHTPYGVGTVARYWPATNRIVVAINQFDEDYAFVTADESDIYDAQETVARTARSMNVGVASDRETFTRLYKSEITGVLSKSNEQKMTATFPMFDDNEVVVTPPASFQPTDMVIARIIKDSRETPAERKARIRRERALATKLANSMLSMQADDADDAVPADVLAEMNEIYGD